jgi:hypothetical protein
MRHGGGKQRRGDFERRMKNEGRRMTLILEGMFHREGHSASTGSHVKSGAENLRKQATAHA